ncbi:MAG: ABC transporter ATP-binding protein [Candidatus Omnitrophica bacterium]|nr:ABC transporter ATP-binding protein [Candidatus Omnitrophota bacterium]MCM8831899.1 ABC transporter ATP-binding protein [Candidatus Omnitrophota bacterium]
MSELVKISSLSKIYCNGNEEVFAVDNINLEIFKNDYVVILGPSGAGKSTLLHIIGGLSNPTSGEVLFESKNIYNMRDKDLALWRSKMVGFVFQFYHLIEELNVLENIMISGLASGESRDFSLKKAKELLKYLELEERKNFFPSQLSGGEKQKVAIARALINEPEILLCDEPTGNLDVDSQEKVLLLLDELNKKNKTIILATHNLELTKKAKRIIFMKKGKIVEVGSGGDYESLFKWKIS